MQISVQLRNLLDDAQFWVEHDTYEPFEMVIRLHHRLVYIHLFPNGNGRHARIFADALLTKVFQLEVIDWAGGYDFQSMNERREQYINALRVADGGNLDPLLSMFLRRVV